MKLLGNLIPVLALVALSLSGGQEPNSSHVSSPGINADFLGTWYLSANATNALWPSAQTMDDFAIEFGQLKEKLAILGQGNDPIMALDYWTRKAVTVADFEIEIPDTEDKLSLQFALLGGGEEARLFASLIQKEVPIGYFTLSKTAPKTSETTAQKSTSKGYWTKVESIDNDIVKLANGAIVEISYGYVGYVGYGKKAFLHSSGTRLWIEGKKDFAVSVLKAPSFGAAKTFERKTISKAADDGSAFVFYDGTSYVVPFATYIGGFSEYQSCFVVSGYILLFDSGELIDSGMMQ